MYPFKRGSVQYCLLSEDIFPRVTNRWQVWASYVWASNKGEQVQRWGKGKWSSDSPQKCLLCLRGGDTWHGHFKMTINVFLSLILCFLANLRFLFIVYNCFGFYKYALSLWLKTLVWFQLFNQPQKCIHLFKSFSHSYLFSFLLLKNLCILSIRQCGLLGSWDNCLVISLNFLV